jgi:hypothetical protein
MEALSFPVYDADHHIYEPEEAFLRHLPKQFQGDFYFVERKGRTKLVIGGMLSDYIPNPTFTVVAAPGSHEKWFRADNAEGKTLRELSGTPVRTPICWQTGEGRAEQLDEQGVHAAVVFPTLASVIEERLGAKAQTTCALIHSLNQWIVDEGGFSRGDRVHMTAYISLADADLALEELKFALEKGAKSIAIRPAPVPHVGGSRSFGHPDFEPFWALVNESGILVNLHCSDSGYDRITNWWKGSQGEFLAFERDAFQATACSPRTRTSASPPWRTARPGCGRCCTGFRAPMARCRRPSPSIRSTPSIATSSWRRSTRTSRTRCATSFRWSACCSAATSRTPKAWPSR